MRVLGNDPRKAYTHIIEAPGKFEAEPRWAPYFWELSMDGPGEYDDEGAVILDVDRADVDQFPELDGVKRVTLWEDSQGFVYTSCEVF